MSFRCDNCGEAQPPGTRPIRVVAKIRERRWHDEFIGWEIESEISCCKVCADNIEDAGDAFRLEQNPHFATIGDAIHA